MEETEEMQETGRVQEPAESELQQLRAQVLQLQAEAERAAQAFAAERRQMQLESAVERALAEAGARDARTVRPLLAGLLEKAEPAEDGSVPGLREAVAQLAADADTAYLFRAAPAVSGAAPADSVTAAPDAAAAGWEARLARARESGNIAAVIQVKRQAAAEGLVL